MIGDRKFVGELTERSNLIEGGPSRGSSERARRESDLLDEALEETFPASDPVSVVRVR